MSYNPGMTRTDSIARIRIELIGIDPTIWRSVEVPLTTSLKGLHDVIQAVMPFEESSPFPVQRRRQTIRNTRSRAMGESW